MSSEETKKLSFESTDFKFNVAYQAYAKAFDEADPEDHESLNDAVTKLFNEEISYPNFYDAISDESRRHQFHRSQISTSRKFAYRAAERKTDRIKRHK
ncbi:hypothetical protein JXL21_09265 [Candidatus Bathyarchaeota archaeon]|nr:hypothetical protein [Candidatus Bathyarchaeota archaeon]